MLFPLFSNAVMPTFEPCSAGAAIKCLLAYTHGLEDCQIEVETLDTMIVLSGQAPSETAIRMAIAIAADISSKPVICSMQVSPTEVSDRAPLF